MSEDAIPKPHELLAARTAAEELFTLLRKWFAVPDSVAIDLRGVDSAVEELSQPVLIMAMAMRKLQALHLITTPGVVTTTDVVLTVIQDLERALLQAPSMHLRDAAASTDWDAEFAAMGGDGTPAEDDNGGDRVGGQGESPDDEITAFRTHHRALHDAARAVLRASDGQIRKMI